MEQLKELFKNTNYDTDNIIIFMALSVISGYLFGFFSKLMNFIVGFLYPMYMSFKSVQSPDKNDDTKWLIYWIVYSFMAIIETISDKFLYWFPFYYTLKLLLTFTLVFTDFNYYIYSKAIVPIFSNPNLTTELYTNMQQMINDDIDTDDIAQSIIHKLGSNTFLIRTFIDYINPLIDNNIIQKIEHFLQNSKKD